MPSRRHVPSLRRRPKTPSAPDVLLEAPQSSVLDVIDELLNKGVVANGEVTLGVAGVDLIYLQLSALLCAADRVLPADSTRKTPARRRRHHTPGSRD